MTDEQLQLLFAAMERHLDKRADAIEGRVGAIEGRVTAIEERFTALESMVERVETSLLTEFHKWASPVEARARGTREVLHALDLEVELLKDRVAKLEGQKPPQ